MVAENRTKVQFTFELPHTEVPVCPEVNEQSQALEFRLKPDRKLIDRQECFSLVYRNFEDKESNQRLLEAQQDL